jgi:hypothetical protein
MQRRVCDAYRHTWVVMVSTTDECPTIHDFVSRCCAVECVETNGGKGYLGTGVYSVKVTDGIGNTNLQTAINLPPK